MHGSEQRRWGRGASAVGGKPPAIQVSIAVRRRCSTFGSTQVPQEVSAWRSEPVCREGYAEIRGNDATDAIVARISVLTTDSARPTGCLWDQWRQWHHVGELPRSMNGATGTRLLLQLLGEPLVGMLTLLALGHLPLLGMAAYNGSQCYWPTLVRRYTTSMVFSWVPESAREPMVTG